MLDAEHAVFETFVEHSIVWDGVVDEGGLVVNFDSAPSDKFAADDVFIELFFAFKFGETPFAVEDTHCMCFFSFMTSI